MKFVIIGYGIVGKAVTTALEKKHVVDLIDPNLLHNRDINYYIDVDGFIICVPTPEDSTGRCNDSLVTDYIKHIQSAHPSSHILIKSTTSIETLIHIEKTYSNNVTFSPEFLRGSTGADPTQEFQDCDFAIYGGQGGRWWHEVFNEVVPVKQVRFLGLAQAGFLKYTENSFLATKVIFFNEMAELYNDTIQNGYDTMIEALALDKRIGMSHTQVPGLDGNYGFGGHCLPKDTAEFVSWAEQTGNELLLLKLVRELNFTKYQIKEE